LFPFPSIKEMRQDKDLVLYSQEVVYFILCILVIVIIPLLTLLTFRFMPTNSYFKA
jgi:hypothetical protein